MSDSERYNEIIRRLAARKQQKTTIPQKVALGRILDDLNVFGAMEDVVKHVSRDILIYGPKSIRSMQNLPLSVGVVLWYRRSGFHGYRTLYLLGIWATGDSGSPEIIIGKKKLPFNAPHYTPEPYDKLIRNGYNTYYQDDGDPPQKASHRLATFRFSQEDRLAQRKMIVEILRQELQTT